MSGSRGKISALAQLRARNVPAYQIPLARGPGDFRYPTFGGEPRAAAAIPAPTVAAAPAAPSVRVSSPALAAVTTTPRQEGQGTQATPPRQAAVAAPIVQHADATDAGTSPTGWGGPGTATAGPDQPASKPGVGPDPSLGPAPGVMNSLADVARVGQTLANFGLAAVSANPISMVRAVLNSPIGMGLMKNASAAFGISRATAAPEDLSSLSKPEPDEGRTALGTIASLAGFGGPAATRGGEKAAKGPDEVTAEAGPKGVPTTEAAPAAAVTANPAPAPAPAAAPAPAPPAEAAPSDPSGLDFGGLGSPSEGGDMGNLGDGGTEGGNLGGEGSSYGGDLNSDPGTETSTGTAGLGSQASESSGLGGGDSGGKGDSAGDGSNGESGAGSGEGGQKRMGGPINNDGDGRLSEVPITAHEGEFVLSPEATQMVGVDVLQRINDMALEAAGHPPRPINPRAMIQSPLSQVRAGAVPPVPGSPGAAWMARPGQQSPVVDRGPMPMPGNGGTPLPAPHMAPPPNPLAFVSVSAPAGPGAGPPLPGPPPGPFPMPPTTPMGVAEGFSENAVPYTEQGQRPMAGPPPAPPAAPPARAAAPRAGGGGGGLTADQLNGMSLDLARGGGTPPAGGHERAAYDRIAGRMQGDGKPAYRMGGVVHPLRNFDDQANAYIAQNSEIPRDRWGAALPVPIYDEDVREIPTLGYDPSAGPQMPDEFGEHELARRFDPSAMTPQFRMGGMVGGEQQAPEEYPDYEYGGDDGGGAASVLPSSSQPYADEGRRDVPFGDNPDAPPGGGMDDVRQRLMSLPPEMQQAVAMAIGSNPMVASALLAVLGPHFAPLIQAAMSVTAPPRQDPMAAMTGGGAPMPPTG